MINRNIGVRIISTNTAKLALFLIILSRNSNSMVAHPLADSHENGDVLNDLLLYSQLRGEGMRYPEEQQDEKTIFDDVSCYHQFIYVWFLEVLWCNTWCFLLIIWWYIFLDSSKTRCFGAPTRSKHWRIEFYRFWICTNGYSEKFVSQWK